MRGRFSYVLRTAYIVLSCRDAGLTGVACTPVWCIFLSFGSIHGIRYPFVDGKCDLSLCHQLYHSIFGKSTFRRTVFSIFYACARFISDLFTKIFVIAIVPADFLRYNIPIE